MQPGQLMSVCVDVDPVFYKLCSSAGKSVLKGGVAMPSQEVPPQEPWSVCPCSQQAGRGSLLGAVGGTPISMYICPSLQSTTLSGKNSTLLSLTPDTCKQVTEEICVLSE